MYRPTRILATCTVLWVTASLSQAGTWTGTTSGTWSEGTNWENSTPPASGDAVVFGTASTANLATTVDAAFDLSGIAVGDPAGDVSITRGTAGSLTLGNGGIDLSAATRNLTFSFPADQLVTLSADQSWSIATGRTLSFRSSSTTVRSFNLGSRAIVKSGDGGLSLGQGLNLTNGSFDLQAGNTTVQAGSNTNTTSAASVSYKVGSSATLTATNNSGTLTFASPVELNGGTVSIAGGASHSLSGGFSGTGGLVLASLSSTGTITKTLSGGFSGSGTFNLQNAVTSGSNHALVLSGNNSGFTGFFNINATTGTTKAVSLNASNAGSATAQWQVGRAANGGNATGNLLRLNAANLALGAVTLVGSRLDLTAAATNATAASLITASTGGSTLSVAAGASLGISGNFTNNWSTTISGAGTIAVTGDTVHASNTTFGTGGTIFSTGTLRIGNGAVLNHAAGTTTVNGAFSLGLTATAQGGTFTLNGGRVNLASGFAKHGTTTGIATVNLGDGTVGALSDWSSALPITLIGGTGGTVFDTLDAVDGATARSITLSGALSGTGHLAKSGAGTLTLSGPNTYSGDTIVTGGVLDLETATLDDSSKVKLSTGATLTLGHGTTDTVDSLYIDDVQMASGTWGAPGSGASHTSPLISGPGLLNVTTSPNAYASWADAAGLEEGTNAGKADDPDHDGLDNLAEFALDGTPLSGVNDGKVVLKKTGATSKITLPVRKNAGAFTADANGIVSPAIDGIIYRIQGSTDLSNWTLAVSESTADTTGLPGLSDEEGWEYRTFEIAGDGPAAFLRIVTSEPP